MPSVILASQSAQRKALFATLGIPFEAVPANLDEASVKDINLVKRAEKLARLKAEAIAQQFPTSIVIAADTYVLDGNTALEKPHDIDEARKMLLSQSGKNLQAVTGFCYIDPAQQTHYSTAVVTEFAFRQLHDAEIEHYISTQPVTTWSAAFSPAYPEGAALIANVQGSFTSFTHGLPIEELIPLLRKSLGQ